MSDLRNRVTMTIPANGHSHECVTLRSVTNLIGCSWFTQRHQLQLHHDRYEVP